MGWLDFPGGFLSGLSEGMTENNPNVKTRYVTCFECGYQFVQNRCGSMWMPNVCPKCGRPK